MRKQGYGCNSRRLHYTDSHLRFVASGHFYLSCIASWCFKGRGFQPATSTICAVHRAMPIVSNCLTWDLGMLLSRLSESKNAPSEKSLAAEIADNVQPKFAL